MSETKPKPRRPGHGSTLDAFLTQESVFEEFQAAAIKEVIAWQIQQAMVEKQLSKNQLAKMMHTSRAQIDRKRASRLTLTAAQAGFFA